MFTASSMVKRKISRIKMTTGQLLLRIDVSARVITIQFHEPLGWVLRVRSLGTNSL